MSARAEHIQALVHLMHTTPRPGQPAVLRAWLKNVESDKGEQWNTEFGTGSLFSAWTATPMVQGLYEANRSVLAEHLEGREHVQLVEVGAGNGELWKDPRFATLQADFMAVDPVAGAVEQAEEAAKAHGWNARGVVGAVPGVQLPEADAIVCSLTLHHVAGWDAEERARHGLEGPGKKEALQAMAESLRARGGILLLNEADIHCDLSLPPGDPVLLDRIVDSYVRRCGMGLIRAMRGAPEHLQARWFTILCEWCVRQLDVAEASVADRDVYELDVGRWMDLLAESGFEIVERRNTDEVGLFFQYVCRPA